MDLPVMPSADMLRAYAASALSLIAYASAASMTACGVCVCSPHSRGSPTGTRGSRHRSQAPQELRVEAAAVYRFVRDLLELNVAPGALRRHLPADPGAPVLRPTRYDARASRPVSSR